MSDFPQIKEWRTSDGEVAHVLVVDQFGHVTHSEVGPSPFVGGSTRLSYAEFLSGRRHSEIRATLGEQTLLDALVVVRHNASFAAGQAHPNRSASQSCDSE